MAAELMIEFGIGFVMERVGIWKACGGDGMEWPRS
jgi:hypothetical protein